MTTAPDDLDHGVRPSASRLLPLTESVSGHTNAIDDDVIGTLVAAFYDIVRSDELLGPIFEDRISDWSGHLGRMCDFWTTLVNRTGRYAGRPIEAHLVIPGLTDEHFNRWVDLWATAVSAHVPRDARRAFEIPAYRMARTMAQRYGDRDARTQLA